MVSQEQDILYIIYEHISPFTIYSKYLSLPGQIFSHASYNPDNNNTNIPVSTSLTEN